MTAGPNQAYLAAMLLLVVAPPREAARIRESLEPQNTSSSVRFADTIQSGLAALHNQQWDAIILAHPEGTSESSLPLDIYVDLAHGAPVIVLVNTIGEEAAAELVRAGAASVVSFSRLTRLPAVLEREVRMRKDADAERHRLLQVQKMDALGILAGGVAHDFNNIFAAILCSAEVLLHDFRRNSNAGEMPEVVFELQTAALRGADLVRQILTFSRSADKHRAPLDTASTIQETIGLLRKTCPANVNIRLVLRSYPLILANASQLQQVLTNICTNAFQAIDNATGTVSLEVDAVTIDATFAQTIAGLRKGAYAHIRVTDDGPGMDAHTLEHIFEPFFTKGAGKGVGLGMAIVHGIVLAHNGIIRVQSITGQGTTVDLWFPRVVGEAKTSTNQKASVMHGKGEHVLIVDDEVGLARIFGRLLQGIGYRVTVQTESAKALQVFEQDPSSFDVVLVDLHMPPPGGIEVAQRIHELRPELPIFMMSGFSDMLGNTLPKDLRIAAILQKPVTRETLANELRRVLDHPVTK